MAWRAALNRGLLPDDEALRQLVAEQEGFAVGHTPEVGQAVQEFEFEF